MVYKIWDYFADPCVDEPITWGYGSYSSSFRLKANGEFSSRFTASALLPDDPDWCESDLLSFSQVLNSKAKGGEGMFKINLSCPEE
jgi:hypothetical protein